MRINATIVRMNIRSKRKERKRIYSLVNYVSNRVERERENEGKNFFANKTQNVTRTVQGANKVNLLLHECPSEHTEHRET